VADPDYADAGVTSSEDEEAAAERKRRRAAFVILFIVFVLLLWWLLSHLALVPNTIGMSERRARIVLYQAGFSVDATAIPAPPRQVGRVLIQNPLGGAWRLTFWPVLVSVGSSAGYTLLDELEIAEGEAGELPTSTPGQDVEVLPSDAEEVAPLYYPPGYYELLMPNVQNMSRSKASAALRRVGLRVRWSEGPSTTGVASGRVYYQKPSPGVSIKWGQSASCWVSEGPFDVTSGPYKGYPYTPIELYPSPEVVPD
jgi:beta-lactam-binding protein with PASTA domain